MLLFSLLFSTSLAQHYVLDKDNPSFLLRGSEMNSSVVLVEWDAGVSVRVNALFEDLSTTALFLNTDRFSYTQKDLAEAGTQGLRCGGFNATLTIVPNSTNNFYISFVAPYYNENFQQIELKSFDSTKSSYSMGSRYTETVLTVVNKRYSPMSCHEFDVANLTFKSFASGSGPNCHLDIFVGAPTYNSAYRIFATDYFGAFQTYGSAMIPPTLSAASYTFVTSTGCMAMFDLVDHTSDTIAMDTARPQFDVNDSTGTSFLTCDYPGRRFSHKGPLNVFQQRYRKG